MSILIPCNHRSVAQPLTIPCLQFQFHRGSAELDAEKWCTTFFTDDIELQYANNPVLKGPAVKAMFSQVFQQLDLMEHRIEYFDFVAPKIYQAAQIRYRVKGDEETDDM